MINKTDFKRYLAEGYNYDLYKDQMAEDLMLNADADVKQFIGLNQRRMQRIEENYTVSSRLEDQAKRLHHKIYWLVVTEHWCGDSSQVLPVLNKVAGLSNGKIEMRLLHRDQNLELMDAYLTNGTRSIPKLVQLDEQFVLTGIWGPRPAVAQRLVEHLISNQATAAICNDELHLWYALNKQAALEEDLSKLLYRANLLCISCLS